MTFETLKEYDKDIKSLCKKFRSLTEDIETLSLFHDNSIIFAPES